MKGLLKFFERNRKDFEKGGKHERWQPLFEVTENFFFLPLTSTRMAPHIRDPLDVKRYMSMVIIGLVPAVLAAWYFFGLRVFALIMVSYAVGGTIEVLFGIIRKEEINEGFLVTGLLFPLVLPPTLPLWITAVGIAFGVIVGKELFGGTGRNLFNPALVGRCFLGLAYPREMSAEWLRPGSGITGNLFRYVSGADVDAVTGATPLGMAKSGEWASITDLFWGHSSGCVGETCSIALIIGGVFLLLTRVGNWRTVVSALGSFVILGTILHKVRPEAVGSVWFHLFAGGLLLGVFFMATDPVSSPNTNGGKWLYGSIIGIITVLIRNFTGYVEGMMFAILLGNIVAPILDEFAVKIRLRRLQHER